MVLASGWAGSSCGDGPDAAATSTHASSSGAGARETDEPTTHSLYCRRRTQNPARTLWTDRMLRLQCVARAFTLSFYMTTSL